MARRIRVGRLQWANALGPWNVRGAIAPPKFSESRRRPVPSHTAGRARIQSTAGMGFFTTGHPGVPPAPEWRSAGGANPRQPHGPAGATLRAMEFGRLDVVRGRGHLR